MASSSSTTLSISSTSTLLDAKAPRQCAAGATSCVALPTLTPPPIQSQSRASRTTAYCRKIVRDVISRATGEAAPTTEVAVNELPDAVDLPDVVKTLQETWDKVEDKYAVGSLGLAVIVAFWASTGMISAIDRLPLIPGILELVGIGYTGWFAYKNLIFKPDREAFFQKVKDIYRDIIGSS